MSIGLFTADLPRPPSANDLWQVRSNRMVKTKAYEQWLRDAGYLLKANVKGQVKGGYTLRIIAGKKGGVHYDLGNYEKPISDLLQAVGAIENDKLSQRINVEWGADIAPDQVRVIVIGTTSEEAA